MLNRIIKIFSRKRAHPRYAAGFGEAREAQVFLRIFAANFLVLALPDWDFNT